MSIIQLKNHHKKLLSITLQDAMRECKNQKIWKNQENLELKMTDASSYDGKINLTKAMIWYQM
jgi:hypothetical protein